MTETHSRHSSACKQAHRKSKERDLTFVESNKKSLRHVRLLIRLYEHSISDEAHSQWHCTWGTAEPGAAGSTAGAATGCPVAGADRDGQSIGGGCCILAGIDGGACSNTAGVILRGLTNFEWKSERQKPPLARNTSLVAEQGGRILAS